MNESNELIPDSSNKASFHPDLEPDPESKAILENQFKPMVPSLWQKLDNQYRAKKQELKIPKRSPRQPL